MYLLERITNSSTALFKNFAGVILIQFAVLSMLSLTLPAQGALQVLDSLVASADFWWGMTSAFGGVVLVGDTAVKRCPLFLIIGYMAAFAAFIALGCDFLLRRPPAMAGGVMAFTVALYLTGVAYARFRRTKA